MNDTYYSESPRDRQGASFISAKRSDTPVQIDAHPKRPGDEAEKRTIFVRLADAVITVSIIALFLGLPLFFTGQTLQGVALEKQLYFLAWVLLGTIAWAAKGVSSGKLEVRKTPIDIPVLILWAVSLAATVFSLDRWHSFFGFFGDPSRGFLAVSAMVLAYYFIISNGTRRRLTAAMASMIVSGGLISVVSSLGIMGAGWIPEALLLWMSPLNFFGSASGFALFIAMLIPLTLGGIFFTKRDLDQRSLWRSIIVWMGTAVVFVQIFLLLSLFGFVSWTATLLGPGMFLVYALSRVIRVNPRLLWIPMAVFVGMLAILMVRDTGVARVAIPNEVSPDMRLSWEVAFAALRDNFFLGTGLGTYGYSFSHYHPEGFNENQFFTTRFSIGTNVFLESLATTGAVGALAVALLILSFVGVGVYLLSHDRTRITPASLGLWSAATVFVAALLTSSVGGAVLLSGVLLSTLAMAFILLEGATDARFLRLSLSASPKYALSLAFVFMVVSAGVVFLFTFIGKVFIADALAAHALRQEASEESAAKMLRAAEIYPQEGRYLIRAAQIYMSLANTEALAPSEERDREIIRTNISRARTAVSLGRDMLPGDIFAQEALAQIYENAALYAPSMISDADNEYRRALDIEPTNPLFLVKIGQLKLSQARAITGDGEGKGKEEEKKKLVEEARDLFQQSVAVKKNFSDGYYQAAFAYQALGDLDAAIESMQKAIVALGGGSVDYAFNLARLYQARGGEEDNQNAEVIFKEILGVNDSEVNTHFSLGLLYEKTGRPSDAISEYQKVGELLPDDDASRDAREQIEEMIANIRNGVKNAPAEAPSDEVVPTE